MISAFSLAAAASRSAICILRGPTVLPRATLIGSAVSRSAGSSLRLARGFAGSPEPSETVRVARKSMAQYEAEIAEAEARTAIAKAAASKATAEASKAVEEAAAVATTNWRRTWRLRAAIGMGIALMLDYVWHDTETVIKWNMTRKLLACERPPTVPALAEPAVRLETGQSTLELSFIPTALLGPTGCGKSTVLKDLARAFILAGIPTFLIGFRMPSEDRPKGKGPLSVPEAVKLMDATARQVYSQVGFPTRRSIIGPLVDLVVDLVAEADKKVTLKAEVDATGAAKASAEGSATLAPSGSRLMTCFTYLFDVAKEVARERQAAGMTQLKAAPVLLMDELEDLIKDDRLKNAGGQFVLNHIATLMVSSSVDNSFTRIAVAGSSAKLVFALASPARSFRLEYEYQADPTRESMLRALTYRKYSEADAKRMVDLCGTRLRLYNGPLRKPVAPPAATFMSKSIAVAERDFGDVEDSLAPADKALFAALLDKVEASYSSGMIMRDNKATMPPSAAAIDLAPILFVDHTRALKFQSQLHRNVWQTERKRPEWQGK